jgi:hypothetical protein
LILPKEVSTIVKVSWSLKRKYASVNTEHIMNHETPVDLSLMPCKYVSSI